MAEKNTKLINLKDITAKFGADTKCGSCEDGKAIGYCCDCEDYLCGDCQNAHKRVKLTRDHGLIYFEQPKATNVKNTQSKGLYCPIHPDSALTSFCETCEELICCKCVAGHDKHKTGTLEEVFPKNKTEILTALKAVNKRLTQAQQTIQSIADKEKEVTDQRAELEKAVDREIEQMEHLLQQLRARCLGNLERLTQEKLKSLNEQRKGIEATQKKLESCIDHVQEKLKTVEGVVVEKSILLTRIEQSVAESTELEARQQVIETDLELYTNRSEHFQQVCQEFLEIVESGSASLDNSHIMGEALKEAKTGEQNSLLFQAMTKERKQYEGKLNLTAELVHIKSKERMQCEVVKQQNGQHKISYRPVKRGKHELHLNVNGNPARGSPFRVTVTPSKPIQVLSGLGSPKGSVVNSKGHIIVIEGGKCISVLTPEGEKIRTFGTAGSGNGQISSAFGITIDNEDNIHVADYSNHRIQKFDSEGTFIAAVGGFGPNQKQFYQPVGICYNPRDNNLYVPDNYNHRIQVLSTDLQFVRSFGTYGTGNGQLRNPFDVAFDNANNMYVADYNNQCIQVFTIEGQFLRAFSQKANGQKIVKPRIIAIDSSSTVYVVEDGKHCISMFSSEGAYITTFGGEGKEEGQFKTIHGLCIDHYNDSVIVSDTGNGRIQKH